MDSVRRTTLRMLTQQRLLSSLVLLYIFQEKPQTNSANGIDRLLNLTGGRIFLLHSSLSTHLMFLKSILLDRIFWGNSHSIKSKH